jgi:hypothetical protein
VFVARERVLLAGGQASGSRGDAEMEGSSLDEATAGPLVVRATPTRAVESVAKARERQWRWRLLRRNEGAEGKGGWWCRCW